MKMKIKKIFLLIGMTFITLIYTIILFVITLLYCVFIPFLKQERFDNIVQALWKNIPTINTDDKF